MLNTQNNDLAISDLFKGDLQLASPPNIYFELQKTVEDEKKSLADAAFIIEKDATLTIRLLKIVNSAFYGFPSQIASIDRAINLIGTKELQSIVLSTIIMDKFSNLPGELISMRDFWARNLKCALIAQQIDLNLGKEFSDSVFVCAILHNIGQLVFFRRIPELAREVSLILMAKENLADTDEVIAEQNVIGFDHYQTGAALTSLWKLPQIITDSIRLHTYPNQEQDHYKIASIIRIADCLSKNDTDCSNEMTNSLGISSSDMSSIIENADQLFAEIFKVFYPE